MEIKSKSVKITTTGENASATGSGSLTNMVGLLLDIYLDYHADVPDTTDVTIAYTKGGNILVVSNSKTDALYAPRQKLVDNAKADITNSFSMFPLDGQAITIALAGSNAVTDAIEVTARYMA